MRTFSLFLSYFCIALICVCCNDDDDTTSSEKTIRLTAEDDYSAIWAIFSDNSGNVLQWKALANRSQNEFKYTLQEDVTLTLIFKGGNSTRLRTYAHISPGDYTVGYGLDPGASQSIGNYKIDISDPNEYVYLYPESEGNCSTFSWEPLSAHTDFPICESPSNFYLALNTPHDDVPRYYYNPQIHSSEGITINDEFVSLLPKMKSKVIAFDKPVYGSSLVYGVTLKKKRYFNASFTDLQIVPNFFQFIIPTSQEHYLATIFSGYTFIVMRK